MLISNETSKKLKVILLAKTNNEEPDNLVVVINPAKTVITEFPYDKIIVREFK